RSLNSQWLALLATDPLKRQRRLPRTHLFGVNFNAQPPPYGPLGVGELHSVQRPDIYHCTLYDSRLHDEILKCTAYSILKKLELHSEQSQCCTKSAVHFKICPWNLEMYSGKNVQQHHVQTGPLYIDALYISRFPYGILRGTAAKMYNSTRLSAVPVHL